MSLLLPPLVQRMSMRIQGCGSTFACVLVVGLALFSDSHAGRNAGAIARLSWNQEGQIADIASAPAGTFPLYLKVENCADVYDMTVTLTWFPHTFGVSCYSPAQGAPSNDCGWVSISGPDASGSQYEGPLHLLESVQGQYCMTLDFTAEQCASSTPATFFVALLTLADSSGAVDTVAVLNCATVAGGDVENPCPMSVTALTPTVVTNSSLPVVTILGSGLEGLTTLVAESAEGYSDTAQVLATGENLATFALPDLNGSSPWTLTATGDGISSTSFQATATTAPPVVTYQEVVVLGDQWQMLQNPAQAWSPAASRLAVNGPGGLHILDVSTGIPQLVLSARALSVSWSPDGKWLVCRTQTEPQFRKGLSSLIATCDTLAPPVNVLPNADVGSFWWAPNDTIYCWYRSANFRKALSAPHATTGTGQNNDAFYPLTPSERERFVARRFSANPPNEAALDSLPISPASASVVAVQSGIPGSTAVLTFIYSQSEVPYHALVSPGGSVLRRLSDRAQWSAVSPDGRYLVGTRDLGDESSPGTQLVISDFDQEWELDVACGLDPVSPTVSPLGYMIAFNDLVTGELHVGMLEINAP